MSLKKLSKVYHYIRCVPKTLFFNFYYLPFSKAIKLPIIVNHRTKFVELGGSVCVPDNAKFGKIKLGFGRVQVADSKYSRFIWNMSKQSEIHLGNNVKIGTGSKLYNQGQITIGTGVNFSGEATIVCNKSISFGNDCLVSWQTLFMDSDLHKITDSNGNTLNSDADVIIEDRVWIGAKTTVLKGTKVARNSVIACGAVVVGTYPPKSIIGGNPAKVIGDMDEKQFHH